MQSVRSAALAAALVSLSAFGYSTNASAIVISPSNPGDWAFDHRDSGGVVDSDPTGVGEFVNGPASPPAGTGSAHLATGNGTSGGDGSEELRNTGYAGTLVSSITELSYSTYMTQNNGQQFPYLGLMIDTSGDGNFDEILFFEPPYQTPGTGNASLPDQGATAMNTWQTWDALTGGWWGTASCTPGTGVGSLSDCLGAAFATSTIVNASGLGGIRFNVGFASPGDQFNGYVDNFKIGLNGGPATTYDFEFAATAVPEPGTLALLGAGLLGMGALRRRRKAKS